MVTILVDGIVYALYKKVGGKPTVEKVVRYPAECVNPPDGMAAEKWIEAGFPNAKC